MQVPQQARPRTGVLGSRVLHVTCIVGNESDDMSEYVLSTLCIRHVLLPPQRISCLYLPWGAFSRVLELCKAENRQISNGAPNPSSISQPPTCTKSDQTEHGRCLDKLHHQETWNWTESWRSLCNKVIFIPLV
jgi:hypothetical protein